MATEYIVLKKEIPAGNTTASTSLPNTCWQILAGTYEGSSAEVAIKAAAEKNGAGEYVAVAARSWNPKRVAVEQRTEVKIR